MGLFADAAERSNLDAKLSSSEAIGSRNSEVAAADGRPSGLPLSAGQRNKRDRCVVERRAVERNLAGYRCTRTLAAARKRYQASKQQRGPLSCAAEWSHYSLNR